MRKILFAVITAVVLPAAALAFTWNLADQSTVSWDPVNATTKGDHIPAGEVEYEVFLVRSGEPKDARASLGRTQELEFTTTFDEEGSYLAGVQAIRTDGNGTTFSESAISWSDNATVVAFDVFGFRFFHAPKHVTGLKKQEVER